VSKLAKRDMPKDKLYDYYVMKSRLSEKMNRLKIQEEIRSYQQQLPKTGKYLARQILV